MPVPEGRHTKVNKYSTEWRWKRDRVEEGMRKCASHTCQETVRVASKVYHTLHLVPLCLLLCSLPFIVIVIAIVVVGLFLTPAIALRAWGSGNSWQLSGGLWDGSHMFEEPSPRPTGNQRLVAAVHPVPGYAMALPGDISSRNGVHIRRGVPDQAPGISYTVLSLAACP